MSHIGHDTFVLVFFVFLYFFVTIITRLVDSYDEKVENGLPKKRKKNIKWRERSNVSIDCQLVNYCVIIHVV